MNAFKVDGEVTVGVRPEHLILAEDGWATQTTVIEPTGSETQITARIEDILVRILIAGRTNIRVGETIYVTADPKHLHLFDTQSGRRIEIDS